MVNSLGNELRMARLAHHLSQERTAWYAQISQDYLSKIERAERTPSDALAALIMWVINHIDENGNPVGVIPGRATFTEKFSKGGTNMGYGDFPYLASEDAQFAKAFRLSESEALELFGGLAGYVRHRANRTKCRDSEIEIPKLSSDLEGEVEKYNLSEVSEKQIAKLLVDSQKTKVAGGMSTIEMNKRFSDQADAEARTKQQLKEMELSKLRAYYATAHGVPEDSQSAKDFGEAEYVRRQTGRGTITQPL